MANTSESKLKIAIDEAKANPGILHPSLIGILSTVAGKFNQLKDTREAIQAVEVDDMLKRSDEHKRFWDLFK